MFEEGNAEPRLCETAERAEVGRQLIRRTLNVERLRSGGGLAERGLQGHLELICAADVSRRSFLRYQSFRAPLHLSKPHLDEGVLVCNVVSPTAGLFAGDRVRLRIEVESGGQLLLATPAATRAHRMPDGRAEVDQEFHVASGAWLENWPELLIPQGGARLRQRTRIHVAQGGELLFFETLAPGRVASGEAFAYEAIEWAADLSLAGRLIARERYRLDAQNGSLTALRSRFAAAYYGACFALSPQLSSASACWEKVHALHEEQAWVGCSALCDGAWVVKVVADDSIFLRRKMGAIRQLLHEALGRRPAALRRV